MLVHDYKSGIELVDDLSARNAPIESAEVAADDGAFTKASWGIDPHVVAGL
jgi:hypothetical protein